MACLAQLTEGWQRENQNQSAKFQRNAIQMYSTNNKQITHL